VIFTTNQIKSNAHSDQTQGLNLRRGRSL